MMISYFLTAAIGIAISAHFSLSWAEVTPKRFVYGPYFAKRPDGSEDAECNSFYLFSPPEFDPSRGKKLPIMIQFHGGGFTGGSASSSLSPEINAYISNGFHYASMDYRMVATKYYYKNRNGTEMEEEFLHVNSSGHIWRDSSGMVMSDYKIKIGRQEFNTKCSYDAAVGLEYLLSIADKFGIDVHSMAFTGGSAGGGEINYLTWVYHAFDTTKYTPRSMVYTMPQLDYPVQNILDRVWTLWGDDIGRNTKLSTILANSEANCEMIIGNPWCESNPSQEVDLCNKTWDQQQRQRFCGPGGSKFNEITIGDLIEGSKWPMETEQDRGLATLWYNSINMQKHQPKPFYLYVEAQLNGTEGMNVVHNAMHARNYGKYASLAGINYSVYYTDYNGMSEDDKGTERFNTNGDMVFNFRTSIPGYLQLPGIKSTARTSLQEQLQFVCYAHAVNCSIVPSPQPPGPGTLSDTCKHALKKLCSSTCNGGQACCSSCIRQNKNSLINQDDCPSPAQNGFERCMEFCTSTQSYGSLNYLL